MKASKIILQSLQNHLANRKRKFIAAVFQKRRHHGIERGKNQIPTLRNGFSHLAFQISNQVLHLHGPHQKGRQSKSETLIVFKT